MKTSPKWLKHAQHVNAITHRNQDSHSNQPQHHERPWQHIGAHFFTFDGFEYLVIFDYYTKMPFIRKIPPSQCNAAKTITVLKELFSEDGIPETIRSRTLAHNSPAISLPSLPKEWNFDHTTSSPRNPRSNGQAEAAVKVVKGLLTRAKYSGQDPYLALLAYRSTPIDAHLRSPAETLYQRVIRKTVPQRIRHKDPQAAADRDHLNNRATQSAGYHDRHCKIEVPAIYRTNCLCTQLVPRPSGSQPQSSAEPNMVSYLVQVIGGDQYRRARDHIRERDPDAVKRGALSQHRCSSSYTRVLTWVVPSETSDSSPSHCTSCSSNTQTTSCATREQHGFVVLLEIKN